MTAPVNALMTRLVDYAGLFPPAGLAMDGAVRRYARYRQGRHETLLGRFIVPATRLEEMADAVRRLPPGAMNPQWSLSILVGEEFEDDLERVDLFERAAATASRSSWVRVDSLEHRVSRPAQIAERLGLVSERLTGRAPDEVFFEIPLEPDPEPDLSAIARAAETSREEAGQNGRCRPFAKIRTGGVTADAFPTPEAVLRFLVSCRDIGAAFKATAGLHHPLRGLYPLTYETGSERGMMFGFLNLFLTASAVSSRVGEETHWLSLLTESRIEAFSFNDTGIRWRDLTLAVDDIAAARREFARSYGSCSFEEPVGGLNTLGVEIQEI